MPSPTELYLHRRYWQRSILIPLWTQQFLLQIVGCIASWFVITIYWSGGPKHGAGPHGSIREQVILGSIFILYLSLTLATLGEMLLFSAKALQPKGYLISQILKFVSSCGVWATLVLYPFAIRDPLASRFPAIVGMEVAFAWLQIPMLSSLVHAGLVWREECAIKREIREQSEALQAAADAAELQGEVSQPSENTPLLAQDVVGYSGQARTTDDDNQV